MTTGSNSLPRPLNVVEFLQLLLSFANDAAGLLPSAGLPVRSNWKTLQRNMKPLVAYVDWEVRRLELEDEVRRFMPANPSFSVNWGGAAVALTELKAHAPDAPETLALAADLTTRRQAEAKVRRDSAGVLLLVKPEDRGNDHWTQLSALVGAAKEFDSAHPDLPQLIKNVAVAFQTYLDLLTDTVHAALPIDPAKTNFKVAYTALTSAEGFVQSFGKQFTFDLEDVKAARMKFDQDHELADTTGRELLQEALDEKPQKPDTILEWMVSLQKVVPISDLSQGVIDKAQSVVDNERTRRINILDQQFKAVPTDETAAAAYFLTLNAQTLLESYQGVLKYLAPDSIVSIRFATELEHVGNKLATATATAINADNATDAQKYLDSLVVVAPLHEGVAKFQEEIAKIQATDPTMPTVAQLVQDIDDHLDHKRIAKARAGIEQLAVLRGPDDSEVLRLTGRHDGMVKDNKKIGKPAAEPANL